MTSHYLRISPSMTKCRAMMKMHRSVTMVANMDVIVAAVTVTVAAAEAVTGMLATETITAAGIMPEMGNNQSQRAALHLRAALHVKKAHLAQKALAAHAVAADAADATVAVNAAAGMDNRADPEKGNAKADAASTQTVLNSPAAVRSPPCMKAARRRMMVVNASRLRNILPAARNTAGCLIRPIRHNLLNPAATSHRKTARAGGSV